MSAKYPRGPKKHVNLETAKERAWKALKYDDLQPAHVIADSIWPGHEMTSQGAGGAASRILKVLEKEGRAEWRTIYNRTTREPVNWGWVRI